MINTALLKFDDAGLIPAIIQDEDSKEVLTLAYMNRESLEITVREGRTCFYSRSRGSLWRKGESSGNFQSVVSITTDCDRDAILVKVRPAGPACHTGDAACFSKKLHQTDEPGGFTVQTLYEMLCERKASPKEGSYTSYLFAKGLDKILKKVGEENAEIIIAAKNDVQELRRELADLAYHIIVLMVECGITPDDLRKELASRHIVDKKEKQEPMGGEMPK